MAPVLGSDATERLLLESFLQLCTDSVFHVRKVGECSEEVRFRFAGDFLLLPESHFYLSLVP